MKNVVLNQKRLVLILVAVLLTYGAHGISYGQVCAVGDILSPGESCIDGGTGDTFSVLADGRGRYLFITAGTGITLGGSINGITRNFIATNRGDGSWVIESVTPGGTTPPETDTGEVVVVSIPDPNLRAAIEAELGKASGATLTTVDMARLARLDARNANITDLTGLEAATNLTELDLGSGSGFVNSNAITDISSLSGLTNLTNLSLGDNTITDISSLSGLTNLTYLDLDKNTFTDISSLAGLTNLTSLWLGGNSITDLSPLVANTGLGNGDEVDVGGNPLSDTSINTHIPTLRSRGFVVSAENLKPTTLEYLLVAPFNRTSMELKGVKPSIEAGCCCLLHPLIEPVWN